MESVAPRYLVIHHTDVACDYKPKQVAIIEGVHKRKGYPVSSEGKYIAYHYFIGCDGTIVNTRPIDEPSIHTGCGIGEDGCKNEESVNERSVAVAIAGNLEESQPTESQVKSAISVISTLKNQYPDTKIIPHQYASKTSCPGKYGHELIEHLKQNHK